MQAFAAENDPEYALWTYLLRDGIREYPYLSYDQTLHNDLQQLIADPTCTVGVDRVPLQAAQPLSDISFQKRPFGVNLIGYAQGQLGIGEDMRCTAAALDSAGIPCHSQLSSQKRSPERSQPHQSPRRQRPVCLQPLLPHRRRDRPLSDGTRT